VHWRLESKVRSHNELTSSKYEKDYDAILLVGVGGVESELALECERTPKAKRRYELVRYKVEREAEGKKEILAQTAAVLPRDCGEEI
jgi:predicted GIY-YIG superfamily endonuclease